MPNPLDPEERERLMKRPRPLPILPTDLDGSNRTYLPLAEAREKDTKYRPIYAVWETTLRCDLACRHCGSRAGVARHDELSTAECLDLVKQLADLGTREVAIIGGEAYLRDDWLDILAAIKAHGMLPTMTTGARGITKELAKAAAEAGLKNVSVSLDGDEATHDRLRAVKGSYRAAVAALGHFRAAGVRVGVNSQINRLSIPHLGHILDRMIENKVVGWQIQLTAAMGRASDEPDILTQPYDLLELFPFLSELEKRARANGVHVSAGNNIGYFGPYEDQLRGRSFKGHHASCGAGRGTIGIEADGTIKGCPSLTTKSWAGGNIRQHPLKDIWERSEKLRYTRDRTVADLWGYCATCYYADECRAGCTWTSEVLFGRPGNNPLCHHRALEMDKAGKRERIVRVSAAPGQPFDHAMFEIVVEEKPASGVGAADAERARQAFLSSDPPVPTTDG
jgi:radical SAM protein with 4Fe4S-binding SPASM domain